ncbi:HepT-like ribonuclease domain-containing protein [Candidatus Magnetominusculus xianensis]|uniref:DUF86 domain-containing protein n=1 Tax=Candidatus Magnetominusculus xianensis TaxID=1748249 RepID=A0ABR5SEW7_9BACT|nr:DUF86 domain-containing protein [Candidatus Magnetominusculus xianensis]KWT85083.1 hypothetical protein ASN18_1808 [Candidatus Magnetominusculus xianensis]MBF0402456.1 DUF86 domain-containing protein [Nitrospirota bacterium]
MNRGNSVYLRHIYDSICRIEQYTKDMVFDSFIDNGLVQAAVIRELEIIGEATKRISIDIRDKYPEIPWKVMAGTRDKLIHHYFGVDIQVVWDTVDKAIPQLKAKIERLFEREGIG